MGPFGVMLVIFLYGAVSSLMLVVNSEAVKSIHLPATISAAQFAVSVAVVFLLQLLVPSLQIDQVEWHKFKHYVHFGFLFGASIFLNMQSLLFTGVGTVIAFRALMPLGVCVLEYLFLGRELPSAGSIVALIFVFVGVFAYVVETRQELDINMHGYVWVLLWWSTVAIHMAYGKYVLQNVALTNKVWGSMLYTNISALPVQSLLIFINNEPAMFATTTYTSWGIGVFALSLVLGCVMSYISWLCMEQVSATQFTLIGVVSKVLSMLADYSLNPKHAHLTPFLYLCVCILASAMYQQPPMMKESILAANKISYGATGSEDSADA